MNSRIVGIAFAFIAFFASSACGTPSSGGTTATDHGRALFQDKAASPGKSNVFACATCHDSGDAKLASAANSARVLPGGSLAGATTRATFWGGQENDLLRAVNDCRSYFMDAPRPWTTEDEDARAMYAFLTSLGAADGGTATVAFSAMRDVTNIAGGDASHGAQVYAAACVGCHGAPHTGDKRAAKFVPILPEYILKTHATQTREARRTSVIDKVRRGAFVSAGDSMPPFSPEILPDRDVADVVTYLGF